MTAITINKDSMVASVEQKMDELNEKLREHKKNPDYYKTQREYRLLSILKEVIGQVGEEIALPPLDKEWFDDIVKATNTSKVVLPQEGDSYLPFIEEHPSYNLKKLQEKLATVGLTCKMGKVVKL